MINVPDNPFVQKVGKSLFAEIENNFKFMTNRFEFIYELIHNADIPNRDEFLPPEFGLAVQGSPRRVGDIHRNETMIVSLTE
jgi:hypothetical protein